MTTPLPELQPGDVLLYKPAGIFGKIIAIKTWSEFSHVEMWMGPISPDRAKPVWASRNPENLWNFRAPSGVNFWPFRTSELAMVRRPNAPVSVQMLRSFTTTTAGQKYDWFGLLKFFRVSKGSQTKMFCSEAVARALRVATSARLFEHVDADAVSPGMLAWTTDLTTIWSASHVSVD